MASTGSSGIQQAFLQQLANQRMLQQQFMAQQGTLQSTATQQPASSRSELAQQRREQRWAERQARATVLAERREAAKARNLVRAQVRTTPSATQLAVGP
jgi:hypothetical protein